MKKLFITVLLFLFSSCFAVAKEDFVTPIPAQDDEVTTSGPDTKFSLATQMRYDAFQEIEIEVPVDLPEERLSVKLYELSADGTYAKRIKIPNAKVYQYTNDTFEIKYKDIPDKIFKYDKNGELTGFVVILNKGKVPSVSYHYDADGQIEFVEIKPVYYNSYVYGLDGFLVEHKVDNKVYDPQGKLIRRKKTIWF